MLDDTLLFQCAPQLYLRAQIMIHIQAIGAFFLVDKSEREYNLGPISLEPSIPSFQYSSIPILSEAN